jgi:hypothetical protein
MIIIVYEDEIKKNNDEGQKLKIKNRKYYHADVLLTLEIVQML